MVVLILTIGAISFLYTSNAKSLYIANEKDVMKQAVKQLNSYNFGKNVSKIDEFLEIYYEQTYDLYICDSDLSVIYSTKRSAQTDDIVKEIFYERIDDYKSNSVPITVNENNSDESIVLKAKLKNSGKTYYVYIEQSLKTTDSVFTYTNRFLLLMLSAFIIASGILMFVLIHRETNSITQLSTLTTKISKGDYSARFSGKIKKDEIGVLAKNFNSMADTISEYVNSLNNYNFLLKEDNKRMTEYEDMRKRVLTNITHELKTPLAIISSQIEMMNLTKDSEKKLYYYNSALEEIDKMSQLISRLLNIQAGEKTIFENEVEIIQLDDMIKALCKKSELLLKAKGIKLETDIMPYEIEAAPQNIEHIFDNYLMNAIQYCKHNQKIKVSLKADDFKCRLSVFNEGSHISKADGENIWTDFYKSKHAKDQEKHSGIGLFIVKEISLINHDDCGFENHDNGVEFWYDFNIKV